MDFLSSVLVPASLNDFIATFIIFSLYIFLFLIGVSERFRSFVRRLLFRV